MKCHIKVLSTKYVLSNLRHLLPEEFSQLRKWRQHRLIALGFGSRRQSKLLSQLRIRRANVFIATLARQPSIESTTDRASLFDGGARDESATQIIHVGNLERVRRIVIAQRCEKLFVAEQLAQGFKHQRAFRRNDCRILKRIAILAR